MSPPIAGDQRIGQRQGKRPMGTEKNLKGMGLKFHRVRPVPVPPKKTAGMTIR